jgi:hypothetical protein
MADDDQVRRVDAATVRVGTGSADNERGILDLWELSAWIKRMLPL